MVTALADVSDAQLRAELDLRHNTTIARLTAAGWRPETVVGQQTAWRYDRPGIHVCAGATDQGAGE